MTYVQGDPIHTDSRKAFRYETVAQSLEEVLDLQNSPSISMSPYLVLSEQTRLLTKISIYSEQGKSREQIRLLYMNDAAMRIWREMGRQPNIIGERVRPPRTALLAFGVPFSV